MKLEALRHILLDGLISHRAARGWVIHLVHWPPDPIFDGESIIMGKRTDTPYTYYILVVVTTGGGT